MFKRCLKAFVFQYFTVVKKFVFPVQIILKKFVFLSNFSYLCKRINEAVFGFNLSCCIHFGTAKVCAFVVPSSSCFASVCLCL